jgi:RimJ/RimL family protein N-acetyltransferase
VTRTNAFGQPIGEDLGRWTPPVSPAHVEHEGRNVRLEPLQRARHAIPLLHTFKFAEDSLWTYMALGPFNDAADIGQLIEAMNKSHDTHPYAVIVNNEVHGFLSYLRDQPDIGVIEIGWITFSPMLQRSTATTETIYLLLEHAFASGYRRVEWKCDALNQTSRNSAERLGFSYEGTFAKATHYKGRNRDTAWFAMTDDDWIDNSRRLTSWLAPDNFDHDGTQRQRLGDIA